MHNENRKRADRMRGVDIREEGDVKTIQDMMKNGAPTFVLIYADWCGHCHKYLPMWDALDSTPGRSANMAKVHHDMQEKIPEIKSAKIEGYPSVIKVLPNGRIQSYPSQGGPTNAVPFMREDNEMRKELGLPSNQHGGRRDLETTGTDMTGGSVLDAFTTAIQRAGPVALLLLANSAIRNRTYKSPKRSSRRASTRRNRRSYRNHRNRRT